MLSILLQLPLQGFLLLNPYFGLNPLEFVPQTLMFILLNTQNITGYYTLKNTAKKQAAYFRIMKLKTDVKPSDLQERYRVS